ncbi:MAG: hypothetical protein PHI34_05680 [Acidobacteriota bacterium]|nr:hypothetical protein [Acidobacteriota bacterium]
MKNIRRKTFVGLAVFALAGVLTAAQQVPAPAPKPADVSGVWEITMAGPQGEMKSDVTFVQKEDAIKVTMASPMGDEMKGEGKVKGNEAEWKFALAGPDGGEFVLVFKAKIDGAKMTGEVQMGEMGSSPFTAIKKK